MDFGCHCIHSVVPSRLSLPTLDHASIFHRSMALRSGYSNFLPTGSVTHSKTERVARRERSRLKMLVFWDRAALPQLLIFLVGLFALVRAGHSLVFGYTDALKLKVTGMLSGIAWPPIFLLLLALLESISIPFYCAIRMLPFSSRQSGLTTSPSNDVDYASSRAKAAFLSKPGHLPCYLKTILSGSSMNEQRYPFSWVI